jgi:general stress protein 26
MTEDKVLEIAKELIKKAQPAYFSTVDENGEPWVRAIENMRNPVKFPHEYKILKEYDDSITPYINTNTSSSKVKHIIANNIASIYFCSPDEYKGIMIKGIVEIINDPDLKKRIWLDSYKQFYPKGHTDPDFTLMRLIPRYLKAWYNTKHHVLELSD